MKKHERDYAATWTDKCPVCNKKMSLLNKYCSYECYLKENDRAIKEVTIK